jgi:hypothetical protein
MESCYIINRVMGFHVEDSVAMDKRISMVVSVELLIREEKMLLELKL